MSDHNEQTQRDEASCRTIERALHARLSATTERERLGDENLNSREPCEGDFVSVTIEATGLRYRLPIVRVVTEADGRITSVAVDAWGVERAIPRASLRHPHPKPSAWECSDTLLIRDPLAAWSA